MATPFESRPMAFLSDIHGNLPALEAVLGELERRGVTEIYAAGDHLLGGDEPLEVWRRLHAVNARCAKGPSDEALALVDPSALSADTEAEQQRLELFVTTRQAVGELVLEQLRRLPHDVRVPMLDGRELLMTHGSPADPHLEITHDLSEEEVLALINDDPADIFVCGATHVPFERTIDELRVLNVGSVGASPEGRVAHYSVVTPRLEGAQIEQTWIDY